MGEARVATIVGAGLSVLLHVGVAVIVAIPRPPARELPADPAPALAGETFELPAPAMMDAPLANASPSPDLVAAPAPPDEPDAPSQNTPPVHGHKGERAAHQGRPSGGRASSPEGAGGGTGSSALYGAVGDRAATDLATAFVHAFRQIASADPAWRTAPIGATGEGTIVLTLDESGHITDTKVNGAGDPLAKGIRSTVTLLKARPFTAKGKTTTLKFSGTISAGEKVGDGLHGEAFAIGSSFNGNEGTAFFALPIGRRIDIKVRTR